MFKTWFSNQICFALNRADGLKAFVIVLSGTEFLAQKPCCSCSLPEYCSMGQAEVRRGYCHQVSHKLTEGLFIWNASFILPSILSHLNGWGIFGFLFRNSAASSEDDNYAMRRYTVSWLPVHCHLIIIKIIKLQEIYRISLGKTPQEEY